MIPRRFCGDYASLSPRAQAFAANFAVISVVLRRIPCGNPSAFLFPSQGLAFKLASFPLVTSRSVLDRSACASRTGEVDRADSIRSLALGRGRMGTSFEPCWECPRSAHNVNRAQRRTHAFKRFRAGQTWPLLLIMGTDVRGQEPLNQASTKDRSTSGTTFETKDIGGPCQSKRR